MIRRRMGTTGTTNSGQDPVSSAMSLSFLKRCLLLLISFAASLSATTPSFARPETCAQIFKPAHSAYFSWDANDHATLMLDLINKETKSISLAYYQWDGNKVGQVLFSALAQAAARGVKVQILVDSWNPEGWIDTQIKPSSLQALANAGIEVKYFNYVKTDTALNRFFGALRPSKHHRMHDKIAVFEDQNFVVTGDRMPQNMNFRMQLTKGNTQRDENLNIVSQYSYLSVMIASESAKAMQESKGYFSKMWELGSVKKISTTESAIKTQERSWLRIQNILERQGINSKAEEIYQQMKPIEDVEFVKDRPGTKGFGTRITDGTSGKILEMLKSAEKEIVIAAPYTFLAGDYLVTVEAARKRNVDVTLIVPSWDSIDTPFTMQIWEPQAKYLQSIGVKVIQHSGPDFMHAKVAVVDGTQAYIGSFNFNRRSIFTDYESGLIVRDSEFIQDVLGFKKFIEDTQPVPFSPLPVSLAERMKISIMRTLAHWIPILGHQL